MKRIWWNWDIRMRWAYGFSSTAESFESNCRRAIDSAGRYGVDGLIIWGFLRDRHGGIDSARRVRNYAADKGVSLLPGVGLDDYGGVYYEGESHYSLDAYLREHPASQAIDAQGRPATHLWPPNDEHPRRKGCPSDESLIAYYRESLDWLIDTFSLDGFQVEQGDSGVCFCDRCRSAQRVLHNRDNVSVTDSARRIGQVVGPLLQSRPNLYVVSETYLGLTRAEAEAFAPVAAAYPAGIHLSWQYYRAPDRLKYDEGVRLARPGGIAALRTNNDHTGGEHDDRRNIRRSLQIARVVGLDGTYIYGEYPDDWPVTRANYEAWAESAKD